jgi:hypothetical protein
MAVGCGGEHLGTLHGHCKLKEVAGKHTSIRHCRCKLHPNSLVTRRRLWALELNNLAYCV